MSKHVTVAVIGAGNRGREVYGKYIKGHPDDIKVVAVAEPDHERKRVFAEEHSISVNSQYQSWEQLLAEDRLADGIIIATLDNMHVEPAIRAMEKGYKILLEKPIAPEWEEVNKIYKCSEALGSEVMVAHVLRYTDFFQKLKGLMSDNIIGEIRYMNHIENIGYYHFAHSYVRGNWRNTEMAAPIILAKSCHDLDLIFWLLGEKAKKLFSSASLKCFKAEKQPGGAADRCLNCKIESDCPYSALKMYLTDNTDWPTSVITNDLSYEGRYKALLEGPYGRCVWKCDNNVPEVQTVNFKMESGTEVNFSLTAFSREINRTIKIFGTEGEIRADFDSGVIKVFKFGEGANTIKVRGQSGGHGGGDTGLMHNYVKFLKGETDESIMTSLSASLESHLMAFAAEKARRNEEVIDLNKWRNML